MMRLAKAEMFTRFASFRAIINRGYTNEVRLRGLREEQSC